jgi:amino acid permease
MQPIPSKDDDHDDHNNCNDDNKLNMWQGVALMTADCLGVGVLALPYDAHELGWAFGISFLLANLPINYIAGNYLSVIALDLETTATTTDSGDNKEVELKTTTQARKPMTETEETVHRRKSAKKYAGIPNVDDENVDESMMVHEDIFDDEDIGTETPQEEEKQPQDHAPLKATYDLISISDHVFQSKNITRLVILLYYTNLFLVLGDYMLVMSRAVSAMFLDQICIPTAGAIASILMFAICQLKTMATIGRKVSVASLIAMLFVLFLCLYHHRTASAAVSEEEREEDENQSIWQKLSALASIAFAVGSQKLFLNIRHELKHREQASRALAWSLTTYGTAYLIVIVLAGPSKFL